MDVNALKGRIAEALVEGIFRRAEYQVALIGRESRVQRLLKIGPDEFLPDLLAWKAVGTLHRLVAIEVKYRAHIEHFLLHDTASLSKAVTQWPDLYFVFVTDNPECGRSCFQAIDIRQYVPDKPMEMTDLHEVSDLGIWSRNVEEHETLVKLIFPLLNSMPRVERPLRKPGARATGHILGKIAGAENVSSRA